MASSSLVMMTPSLFVIKDNKYHQFMSFLEHILQCNRVTPENYLSFRVNDEELGKIQKSFAAHLRPWGDVFVFDDDTISLSPSLDTPDVRTAAIEPILLDLHQEGIIDSWVGEKYAVTQVYGETPRFLIERAAVSFFGLRGYGVHVNGLVRKAGNIYVWVAKRAMGKPFWPGKLDQMVAGGQPYGIGRLQNVIKESAEEANIPESIARTASLVSEIHYRGETHRGMQVDTLFNYDLWLPADFMPQNTDGEVDEFILMDVQEMATITDTSNDFKDNCNLVNIDLLIRLGLINEQHPDYKAIMQHLYARV